MSQPVARTLTPGAVSDRIKITSVFQTLRPCLKCGVEFYPPKRTDRRIADYCSYECEKAAGLRAAERCYRQPGKTPPTDAPTKTQPSIKIVPRSRLRAVRNVHTTRSRFGANVQLLRRANDWTQQDLADRLDVVRESVRRWENDHGDPSADHVHRLARLFGVSMDDLWTGSPVARTEVVS